MFIDFKPQTALLVILGHSAEVGIGGGIGSQALFEFGIIGVDLSGAIIFVEIQFGDFSFLLGYLLHQNLLIIDSFPRL